MSLSLDDRSEQTSFHRERLGVQPSHPVELDSGSEASFTSDREPSPDKAIPRAGTPSRLVEGRAGAESQLLCRAKWQAPLVLETRSLWTNTLAISWFLLAPTASICSPYQAVKTKQATEAGVFGAACFEPGYFQAHTCKHSGYVTKMLKWIQLQAQSWRRASVAGCPQPHKIQAWCSAERTKG